MNIPVEKEGLKTNCNLYLDKKYSDDLDIMKLVMNHYDFEGQYIDAFVKQGPAIKRSLDKLKRDYP